MSYTVGILGKGFVGGAMYENFKEVFNVLVWDVDPEKRNVETFDRFVENSDIIFVCVPTPMKDSGECDTHIVASVLDDISRIDRRKYVVIKSTVTPGTTQRLAADFNMTIAFNPEFLTEANAYNDFRFQPLIVLGADDQGINAVLSQIYSEFNMRVDNPAYIVNRTTKEAEMFKYLANCFLATKVIFANEFKILCDKADIDYNKIAEIAMLDKRLGKTHWKVPGPDGKMGFGGSCFPKDTAAMIHYSDEIGSALWLLTEATYINDEIRDNDRFSKLAVVESK